MFISIRKKIGTILFFTSSLLLLGMAGADDLNILNKIHTPLFPLILKAVLYLSLMAVGVILIGGASDENCD